MNTFHDRPEAAARPGGPGPNLVLPPATMVLFVALIAGPNPVHTAETRKPDPSGITAAGLFGLTNVWTVQFKFTADQWSALEPKGPGGFFGEPGGGRRPPVAAAGFGPGMFVAPAFMARGDQDRDARLSRDEFRALSERWFSEWDKAKAGRLDLDQLRAGLNLAFVPPNGPPRGEGFGGRSPGLNLQGPEGKRNGLASAMGIEFEYVGADLEFEGRLFTNVAVRYKGNGTFLQSRGSLKRSFKVDLNEFVRGQKLAGVSKLNFHNNVTDASWMNEVLSHRLFRDAGVPAPRTAYARVYVTVPGQHQRTYFGLYSLVENIDNTFTAERFGAKQGAIFKPVTPDLFADLGEDWKSYRQTYDPKGDLSSGQSGRLIEFCRLVTHAKDAEFGARLGDFIELDEFARYMAVLVWLADLDGILGPGQNLYLYLDPGTQRFQFVPWDLDHSFGQFPMRGSQEQRERLSIHKPWQGRNRFLERVFNVPAFKTLYLDRLAEFSASLFRPERFHRQVDELAAAIRPAVAEESSEKLEWFDRAVAGLAAGGAGGPNRFFQATKPIKGFAAIRSQSVSDQIAGRSEGLTLGEFGFGMRGPGPGGSGAPGGAAGFGPGNFLAAGFMNALDADKDGALTREEFQRGFAEWHRAWNADRTGLLTEDELRAGINRDLVPFRGPGGRPGRGPG